MNNSLRLLLLALLMCLTSLPVFAQKRGLRSELPEPYINKSVAPGSTVWFCAYNVMALSIDCRLGNSGEPAAASAASDPAVQNPKLPQIARRIWGTPESLAGHLIRIPLHAPPFEFALVGQLAESVMCGARNSCGILFANNQDQLAVLVKAFELTGMVKVVSSHTISST